MASSAAAAGREHRMEVPAAACGDREGSKAAAPEKLLNRFVHLVASMERVGNALGTLSFMWATVVLLGGYQTALGHEDFEVTTFVVFLEALRMFGRDKNRLDYQLFFCTRGAFRSLGWDMLILTTLLLDIEVCVMIWSGQPIHFLMVLFLVILVIGLFLSSRAARLLRSTSLCHAISLWSPMVAILLLFPSVPYTQDYNIHENHKFIYRKSMVRWTLYLALFAVVLLLTMSKLRFSGIIKLVDCALGRKLVSWRRVIINSCMFAATMMLVLTFHGAHRILIILFQLHILFIVSSGNLQFPAGVIRIGVAMDYLHGYYEHVDEKNLLQTINIFYVIVLGQGIFYIVACKLDVFSFILRRSLVRRAGFRGPSGVEFVNLYYAYAFEKCMRGAVLAPKKISLITFAVDSLKSGSPKMQLYGLQMLHNILEREPLNPKVISQLTTSTKTMTSLFNMLGWNTEVDKYIRLFAAKVVVKIADRLRVVLIPGAMQLIASLLDTVHQPSINYPLLDSHVRKVGQDISIQRVDRNEQITPMLNWWKQMAAYCLIPAEEPSNNEEPNSRILKYWKWITEYWSVPEEEPSTGQDLLPVLGLRILDRLSSFDFDNCMEISRATGLISKIIQFTSSKIDMKNANYTHQILLKASALKLLRRLARTKGKLGVTLRQMISEHPFLLSNLAEILDDSGSSQELTELTAELLRNLAVDGNINEEIGHNRVIISRLMHAFLNQGSPSSTDSDHLLRKTAGQALAVLAMQSTNSCLLMLAEPKYVFITELRIMILGDRYRYIASSLLQSMCVHARPELGYSDLNEVSYIFQEVLQGIINAEGTELEVLVGLSSQICRVIPEDFARGLEHGQIKERFIKRLVNALNSNMIPDVHCPGIRRVIVEHAIYMMESNPSYAYCFNNFSMMEALLKVERTPSRAENYRFFLGDAGLMEHRIPLSALVARAKELMGREGLRRISVSPEHVFL